MYSHNIKFNLDEQEIELGKCYHIKAPTVNLIVKVIGIEICFASPLIFVTTTIGSITIDREDNFSFEKWEGDE